MQETNEMQNETEAAEIANEVFVEEKASEPETKTEAEETEAIDLEKASEYLNIAATIIDIILISSA